MIKVVTPTETYCTQRGGEFWFKDDKAIKVFLAGTIDNGESKDWQRDLIYELTFFNRDEYDDRDFDEDFSMGDIIVFNPRRDDWKTDATVEDIEYQIKWEQDKLDEVDVIIMYLDDDSKSPISLLELGLYGPNGKMIVFCTDKFYRYHNVKLTCERFSIPLINTSNMKNICSKLSEIYDELKEN